MVEYLGYTPEDLFEEVFEYAKRQGVTSPEEWNDAVEQVLDDHREFEEMDPDAEDVEMVKEHLQARWPDYAATLSSEKPF